jgi:8-oxo-dGTP diphosphatase
VTVRTCLCLLTRPAPDGAAGALAAPGPDRRELLLGYKKAGFGAGRWVGLGGHVEDGEEPADAAVREVAEESGLIVAASALTHMATLRFLFPARPTWDQSAEVFATTEFSGEPAESDELIPRWFPVDELPLDGMWDDARHWLPLVLAGERVSASITFADDCATVEAISPDLPVLVSTRRKRQF